MLDQSMQRALRDRELPGARTSWKLLLFPKQFAAEKTFESLDDWKLSEKQLIDYGKQVTKLREIIVKRSEII